MGECYVCTEECYTLSPCKCKSAYLHDVCYAKLIAYDNKNCTICLTEFPKPEIDISTELSSEHHAHEIYPPCYWVITPLLMRPVYYQPFNVVDSYIDVLRNILWLIVYMCIFHSIDYPDTSMEHIFDQSELINWLMCIIIHITVCVIVRSACTKKRPPQTLLP